MAPAVARTRRERGPGSSGRRCPGGRCGGSQLGSSPIPSPPRTRHRVERPVREPRQPSEESQGVESGAVSSRTIHAAPIRARGGRAARGRRRRAREPCGAGGQASPPRRRGGPGVDLRRLVRGAHAPRGGACLGVPRPDAADLARGRRRRLAAVGPAAHGRRAPGRRASASCPGPGDRRGERRVGGSRRARPPQGRVTRLLAPWPARGGGAARVTRASAPASAARRPGRSRAGPATSVRSGSPSRRR